MRETGTTVGSLSAAQMRCFLARRVGVALTPRRCDIGTRQTAEAFCRISNRSRTQDQVNVYELNEATLRRYRRVGQSIAATTPPTGTGRSPRTHGTLRTRSSVARPDLRLIQSAKPRIERQIRIVRPFVH